MVPRRIISACRNKLMAISDLTTGRLVTTAPIGAGVDAARLDPGSGDAFASNGDGLLTVVHEETPDRYTVVRTVETMPGARTMELDPTTHTPDTVSAKLGPEPPAPPGRGIGVRQPAHGGAGASMRGTSVMWL